MLFGQMKPNRFTPAILAVLLSASLAQSPRRTGSITGRVIDEGGRPFAFVIVSVHPVNGSKNEEREIATDENGLFEARNLPDKAYTVECYAPGYVEDENDDSKDYHLVGQSITLRLIKGGVITGTVTDASGDPLVKGKVAAIRLRDADGRVTSPYSYDWFETDDRGVYRIYGLEAGSYIMRVTSGGEYEDKHITNEAPAFYPSATRDNARMVSVQPGQETAGIDIRLRGERGYVVSGSFSGSVKNGSPSDEAYVKLIDSLGSEIEARYFSDNAFAFYGVADGDYFILARNDYDDASAASMARRITVRGSDVTGLDLRLAPLGSITGRVILEVAPKNKARCKDARALKFEEMVVAAFRDRRADAKDQPAFLFDSSIANAADEKGSFALENFWPGLYRLRMVPINENLFVRAVNLRAAGGQSVNAAQNAVAIKSGDRVKGITIILAEGAASLRGRLVPQDEKTKLPSRLRVHLAPVERVDDPLRFYETSAQSDHSFALINIAPGRYLIYVRLLRDDETGDAIRPAAWDVATRAALRREAESAGVIIDLQPCQRVSDYALRYPTRK